VSLSGPRLEPRSGKAASLVVFLHGYGADGNDLIGIGREWQRHLPETAFVAPQAPQRCTMGGTGFQWFPLTFRDPHERWKGVQAARPTVDGFIDEELARYDLPASRLVVVGFSQGTMMALHVGLRRAAAPAAIIGYSGTLEGADTLAGALTVRPPILLVHGSQDDVIPIDALFAATDALCAAEVPAQWHMSLGVGHGIDQEGLRQGLQFAAAQLGVKLDLRS